MSLSVRRIALLLSFASAVLVTACDDDPKVIGLPQDQSLGVFFTDDVNIQASTVLVDSVPTRGSAYMLAGQYADPKLGVVTARSYFQPIYTLGEFTAANATRADSAVLVLPYSYFYGDTTRPYTVSVHLLEDSIRRKAYYSFDEIPYQQTSLAQATFLPRPTGSDSVRTLRLKLPAAVADQLLSYANKPQTEFLEGFPGFALVGEDGSNNVILGFPAGTAPRLRLYYQTDAPRTYDFALTGNPRFNHISSDRAGTPVANVANGPIPSAQSNQETYVQGGVALMTRLTFTNLDELKELGTIAINRAQLIVTPLPGSVISARSRLILYNATPDGKILRDRNNLPFYINGDFGSLALADYRDGTYTFNITAYISRLLLDRLSNNGLYLSLPSAGLDAQSGNSRAPLVTPDISLEDNIGSVYLGGPDHPAYAMKLRIYYTPVNAN